MTEIVERTRQIVDHLDVADPDARRLAADCVGNLITNQQPIQARQIADRFVVTGETTGNFFFGPLTDAFAQLALTLGDRDGFDTGLDAAFGNTQLRRASWFYEGHNHQLLAMREMLDGNWAAAEAAVAIAQRVSGHDLNMALGCLSQRSWIAAKPATSKPNTRRPRSEPLRSAAIRS